MAILSNLPTELEYYGVKWSIFYSNLQGKRVDYNIYKKGFTGTSLCTENEIDLCTEAGDILTPGAIYIEQFLVSEDELYLITEDDRQLSLGITSAKTGKETECWAEIIYDHIGVTMNQSFSDGDIFKPISGTSFQLQFYDITGHDFDELFEAKNYQYYFELLVDSNVIGLGYLLPETIQKDYGALPNTISILATDGLGLLKDIAFKNNDGTDITGIERLSDIFTFLFYKAGLRTTWLDKIHIKPLGANSFTMKTYIDTSFWIGKTCEDVLNDLISTVNGQVTSYKDMFILRHINEPSNGFAIRYNWNGIVTNPVYIVNDTYVIQDKAKYDGRGMLTVEKPWKKITLQYSRELIEDLSIDWPEPTFQFHPDVLSWQWYGGWIIGKKHVEMTPIWSGVEHRNRVKVGLLLDWNHPYLYPETSGSRWVKIKIPFKFNLWWEDMQEPIPEVPENTQWWCPIVYEDDVIVFGYGGFYKMKEVNSISGDWQTLEFVVNLDLSKHIKILIDPFYNFPSDWDVVIETIEYKDWEICIVKDEEGNLYDSDDIEHSIDLIPENNVEQSISKVLGATPITLNSLCHVLWKYMLLQKVEQKYTIVNNWIKKDQVIVMPLWYWIVESYKNHYLQNKFRYSITIFNEDELSEITPFTIIRDLNINQDFVILSMQYVPKLNHYSLELIGFVEQ